jgi:hypothetical protein
MRVTGLSAVRTELRYYEGAIPDAARKQMHRSAARIVANAKEYAPEDEANLVRGIKIIKDYAGMNGRLQIDVGIEIPPDAFSAGGTPLTAEDFDRYVTLVHENYESILTSVRQDGSPGGPSKRSREKMMMHPDKFGSGFLRTATEEEAPKLVEKTIFEIDTIIRDRNK